MGAGAAVFSSCNRLTWGETAVELMQALIQPVDNPEARSFRWQTETPTKTNP